MSHLKVARVGFCPSAVRAIRPSVPLALLMNDLLGLTAAFMASTAITATIQRQSFAVSTEEIHLAFPAEQLAIACLLSLLLVAWFVNKRHYSSRQSYWVHVKHVLIAITALAIIGDWLNFALEMQASRVRQFFRAVK